MSADFWLAGTERISYNQVPPASKITVEAQASRNASLGTATHVVPGRNSRSLSAINAITLAANQGLGSSSGAAIVCNKMRDVTNSWAAAWQALQDFACALNAEGKTATNSTNVSAFRVISLSRHA
ncbi:MAG TPA: hypothetical protein VOA64_20610 [Candidatus Dormibacteraeota bacterium]|nr:hypothetical protein [Candidatus Dormibacteraeota bacterium]